MYDFRLNYISPIHQTFNFQVCHLLEKPYIDI